MGLTPAAGAATSIGTHAPVRLSGLGNGGAGAGGFRAHAASSDSPLSPGQIRTAYSLPAKGARGQRIAVVSTYDAPHVEADLKAYDDYFGLPACTTANGCFKKLNEQGQPSPVPIVDPTGGDFITESSMGVEIAHGICQSCSIRLIEANAGDDGDIAKAIAAGAASGANIVVTAVTADESPLDTDWTSTIAGVHAAVVAASGDAPADSPYGFGGINFPASLPSVLSVGGTQLSSGSGGRYGSERVWSPSVSGCSNVYTAGSWQTTDAAKVGCASRRAVADVAAMSEPGAMIHITGVSVPGGPWYAGSGTSLSAPIIAAAIGLAGSVGNGEARLLYQRAQSVPAAVHDIVSGANTSGCRTAGCMAVRGFDGPTGVGTPNGLGLFQTSGGSLNPRSPQIAVPAPRGALRVSRSWKTSVGVRNGNPISISGKIVLRQKLRIGGRSRTVVFATTSLSLGARHSATRTLTIARGERALLKHLHRVYVDVQVQASGSYRPSVTVTRRMLLVAP